MSIYETDVTSVRLLKERIAELGDGAHNCGPAKGTLIITTDEENSVTRLHCGDGKVYAFQDSEYSLSIDKNDVIRTYGINIEMWPSAEQEEHDEYVRNILDSALRAIMVKNDLKEKTNRRKVRYERIKTFFKTLLPTR